MTIAATPKYDRAAGYLAPQDDEECCERRWEFKTATP
jgi:hypothetical protein